MSRAVPAIAGLHLGNGLVEPGFGRRGSSASAAIEVRLAPTRYPEIMRHDARG